jgi:hypothetical protein
MTDGFCISALNASVVVTVSVLVKTKINTMQTNQNSLPSGYDYEFISVVSDEYFCSICAFPMRKPVQTKCGHRFCKGCLDEANKGLEYELLHELQTTLPTKLIQVTTFTLMK